MSSFRTLAVLLVSAVGLGACADGELAAPLAPAEASFASTGPVLVECPTDTVLSTTGSLGALGGEIRLNNHRLNLPMLAVVQPTQFGMETPASNYMELDVRANGAQSYQFREAVTITIDYSRCTRTNIDKAPLTVWQIDPETKALIENMGGVDDKTNRTITFETDHLSTYSIAQ